MPERWAIITGEYPPQTGGVSDYTRLVAEGLANRGHEVHVWAPRLEEGREVLSAVDVHRLPGSFGPRSLVMLERELRRLPRPLRLLVQYVPHAYGYRALNLAFCAWLYARRRRDPIWVMCHEVAFPWLSPTLRRTNLLAAGHRAMAALVARAARRLFVSTPAYADLLGEDTALAGEVCWLPVPSNLPTSVDPTRAREVRAEMVPPGHRVVGHFGTYNPRVQAHLLRLLVPLLEAEPNLTCLLMGRNSRRAAGAVAGEHPDLAARLRGAGELEPDGLVAWLAACDLLLQPYPDGVSSRRGSLMAGLALGVPLLTTRGALTEPVWEQAVALYDRDDPEQGLTRARELLAAPERLLALGGRGRQTYGERFALERTLDVLTGERPGLAARGHA